MHRPARSDHEDRFESLTFAFSAFLRDNGFSRYSFSRIILLPKPICIFSSLLIALAALGCGSSKEPLRHAVAGIVKVDGQNVKSGSLSFLPARGTVGPAATTVIVDGKYSFHHSNGPYQGSHRVMIGIEPAIQEAGVATTAAQAKRGSRNPKKSESKPVAEPELKRTWEIPFVVPDQTQVSKDFELSTTET
ncbi:hypothetical protein CA13_47230 [Planctomycetes bacterium CA13]|uniref:Carboxypeptidase regulatory-like domain-containing protein n=1 Tax=Novipirellula herctigrandis TaxID=2527986 RepID=A0A5C5Z7P6_9BACT|nr:hypothetical protein CA13_47230 [Planctomycetes bacterium CA13]